MDGTTRALLLTALALLAATAVAFTLRWEQEPWTAPAFEPADVNMISIRQGPDHTALARRPGGWVVLYEGDHGAESLPADEARVDALLEAWRHGVRGVARSSSVDPDPVVLSDRGLSGPIKTEFVLLHGGTDVLEVSIGSAEGGVHFVRSPADPRIGSVRLPTVPSAASDAWADHRLLPYETDHVLGFDVEGAAAISLHRAEAGSPWQGPPDVPLRQRSVDLLLASAVAMEWTESLPFADFHGYAEAMPIATTVRIRTAAHEARVVEFAIPHGPDGVVFARVGTTLFRVDAAEAQRLHEGPAHLTE